MEVSKQYYEDHQALLSQYLAPAKASHPCTLSPQPNLFSTDPVVVRLPSSAASPAIPPTKQNQPNKRKRKRQDSSDSEWQEEDRDSDSESGDLLEDKERHRRTRVKPRNLALRRPPKRFPVKTTTVLQNWLQANLDSPLPSAKQKQEWIYDLGLTAKQIQNWFWKARIQAGLRIPSQLPRASPSSQDFAASAGEITIAKRSRHNFPSEKVVVLEEWFNMHRDYPYPSSEEKHRLADIVHLSYLQVQGWFVNARMRRIDSRRRLVSRHCQGDEKDHQRSRSRSDKGTFTTAVRPAATSFDLDQIEDTMNEVETRLARGDITGEALMELSSLMQVVGQSLEQIGEE